MRFNTYLTLIVLLYGCNHNSNNDNAIENGHTIIEVNPNEIETITSITAKNMELFNYK
jgi:hypothetical protein